MVSFEQIEYMLKQFYLGDWQVEPASNTLILGKTKRTVEPKAMDVLLLLCQQAGEVVSADDIITQCWPDAPVGDNPIHKTITQLRKALGDKASAPSFIETIRKRGYRVIADVQFLEDEQTRAAETDWQGQSPFPGLTAFTQQESQVYYGRNAAVKIYWLGFRINLPKNALLPLLSALAVQVKAR